MSLRSFGILLLSGSALAATQAAAQTEAPAAAPAAEATSQLGNDIVVTALRRSTTLQDTPISISAIGGEALNRIGATSINDYFRQVPNLQVEGNAPASRRITIRGVRSAGEATVGLYYDETPLTGPGGTTADAGSTNPDINLFDVERVEVLRGPQGTLFGAGSMGGTIRMIYNKPDATKIAGAMEVQGTVTKNGDPGFYAKGMINLPIATDVLALRVVAYKENRGGFIDVPGLKRENVNDVRSWGGRVMLRFTPDDNLAITASANYQRNELDGPTNYNLSLGVYNSTVESIARNNDRLQLYNLTLTYKLPFNATFTGSASTYNWDLLRNSDYTKTLRGSRTNATSCRNYIGVASCNASQMATYSAYVDSRLPGMLYQPLALKAWIYEARVSGSLLNDGISYTLGIFHDDRQDRADSQVAKADANGNLITPLDLTAWRIVKTSVKQTAFFAELSVKPVHALTLTAGTRRFSYDKTVFGQVQISNYITQSYVGPPSTVDASAKGWVHKFNASYDFDRDFMVYATASKGFRPGGANNVPGLTNTLVAYQPDSLWNYEIGAKTQWFNRMLTLNAAVYQIDWRNMQVSGRSANGAFSFLTNAGKARIKGAEIEATLRPVEGLSLNTALGFVDAKLTEDQLNSGLAATGSTGLKGDRIPYIPQFTLSLGGDYRWSLSDTLHGTVSANLTHSAGSYSEFRPTYTFYRRNSAYENVGMRAGIETDNGLTLQLFVQNLFNTDKPIQLSSSIGDPDSALTLQPRTFGIMARKTF
ncbi:MULTISPECIES: TonB-dependent receptor [unclassified Sphingomonas]|uniref:TonB-dependent receptor n=1 Tax=unclassified Sphingomonas TaxID=196159 RepID=UPI00092AD4A5|nr:MULTISPECIES: TonB-dependent receptor [unclassified Sphingomonas]OJU17596.1 MAG: TonB-dependent receptor [Sphingomonas sp. 66-10]